MKRDSTGSTGEYRYAFRQASPIIAGYFTVSFVFGIMAVHQGLPVWLPALMSLMVYAGASQFSFLTLAMAGASLSTIVLTTFLINLRHMLMSVYMSSVFEKTGMSKKLRLWYAFGLTDESFATHSVILSKELSKEKLGPRFLIAFNTFCHVSWVLGALSGSLAVLYASELVSVKLDYALMAMMLYVLVSLIDSVRKLVVALVSIVVMSLLSLTTDSHINVFVATFIGCWVATWNKTKIFSS